MANGIVLGGKLKFRKKASTSGTVITSIPTGTVLSVSAVSGNDSWYQTTYSTYGTGYVMKSFVAVASDTVEVNATNVNVRNSANGSTVLYTLSSPATATVQDVSSDWVKIQPSGKKVGWIKADYVNKKSSGSSSSGGNSSGGGSSPELIGKSGMVVVNASGLNVRSSANGSLLSYKLYNGEKVTILEVSTPAVTLGIAFRIRRTVQMAGFAPTSLQWIIPAAERWKTEFWAQVLRVIPQMLFPAM